MMVRMVTAGEHRDVSLPLQNRSCQTPPCGIPELNHGICSLQLRPATCSSIPSLQFNLKS